MKFLAIVFACAALLAATLSPAEAGKRRRHRSKAVPSALRGGASVMWNHNLGADADGLSRIEDRAQLRDFIEAGLLVPIGGTASYRLETVGGHDSGHAHLYAHARPWTRRFLDAELGTLRRTFGLRAKVTSLVRTADYQRTLCRSGNAAAICGGAWWQQSLHLTGATVDISKEGMSKGAKAWMRKRLRALQKRGLVGAIEEHGAFHVFVRKAYGHQDTQPEPKPDARTR